MQAAVTFRLCFLSHLDVLIGCPVQQPRVIPQQNKKSVVHFLNATESDKSYSTNIYCNLLGTFQGSCFFFISTVHWHFRKPKVAWKVGITTIYSTVCFGRCSNVKKIGFVGLYMQTTGLCTSGSEVWLVSSSVSISGLYWGESFVLPSPPRVPLSLSSLCKSFIMKAKVPLFPKGSGIKTPPLVFPAKTCIHQSSHLTLDEAQKEAILFLESFYMYWRDVS